MAARRPFRALESSVEFEFCSLLAGDSTFFLTPYPEDFTLAKRGFLFLGSDLSVAFVFLCLDLFSEDGCLSATFVVLCLDLFNADAFVFLCLEVFSEGNLVLDAAGFCL